MSLLGKGNSEYDTIVKGVMVNYGNLIKLLWSCNRDIDIKSNAQSKFNYLVLEVTDGKMDLNLYFYLVTIACKVSITFQETIKNDSIASLNKHIVNPSDGVNKDLKFNATNTPENNTTNVYFKTVTEPKVKLVNLKSLDYLYDDMDDNNQSNFIRSENNKTTNKLNSLLNIENHVESTDAPSLIAERRSQNSNEKFKSPVDEDEILPDFVIDQIVFEESASNVNLKSTVEELEKKVASYTEKEKHKFSRLFQEIKNLYSELDQLKKIQKEINRTQEILTRRDNLANERLGNELNLPTEKVCSKTKPLTYPIQRARHWTNQFVRQNPIIHVHKPIVPFSLNLPYLRTTPIRFSPNVNKNHRFIQHTPLFKYFH